MAENDYSTTWVKNPVLIPLGGVWAYAVGIVVDKDGGDAKLRIIKGKRSADKPGGVSQVQRMNFKNRKQWDDVKALVDLTFDQLENM